MAQWLKARMQQRLAYDRTLFYHGSAGLLIAGTLAMVLVALGMPTGFGTLVDIGGFVSLNTVALYAAAQLCSVLLTLVFVPVPRLFAGFFLYVGFEAYFILYYSEFGMLMAALFAAAYAICGAVAGSAARSNSEAAWQRARHSRHYFGRSTICKRCSESIARSF